MSYWAIRYKDGRFLPQDNRYQSYANVQLAAASQKVPRLFKRRSEATQCLNNWLAPLEFICVDPPNDRWEWLPGDPRIGFVKEDFEIVPVWLTFGLEMKLNVG